MIDDSAELEVGASDGHVSTHIAFSLVNPNPNGQKALKNPVSRLRGNHVAVRLCKIEMASPDLL